MGVILISRITSIASCELTISPAAVGHSFRQGSAVQVDRSSGGGGDGERETRDVRCRNYLAHSDLVHLYWLGRQAGHHHQQQQSRNTIIIGRIECACGWLKAHMNSCSKASLLLPWLLHWIGHPIHHHPSIRPVSTICIHNKHSEGEMKTCIKHRFLGRLQNATHWTWLPTSPLKHFLYRRIPQTKGTAV